MICVEEAKSIKKKTKNLYYLDRRVMIVLYLNYHEEDISAINPPQKNQAWV